MYALATTTVSILRGTRTDPVFGDAVAAMSVVASGIPASIIEKTRRVTTPGNATPRVTRGYEGVVGSQVDVSKDDRLQDERTGLIYVITAVSQSAQPGIVSDQSLDLRRAT